MSIPAIKKIHHRRALNARVRKPYNFYLDKAVMDSIYQLCEEQEVPLSGFVEELLIEAIEQVKASKEPADV